MDRIIEVEGRKYNIGRPLFEVSFVDSKGTEVVFDDLGLYNPNLQKKLKLTTIRSALKWWIENRSVIINLFEGTSYHYDLRHVMEMYFGYIPWSSLRSGSYDDLKEYLTGLLLNPSLKVSFRYASGGNILLDNPSSEEVPFVTVLWNSSAHMTLVGSEDTRDTNWTTHWNYTFKMDEHAFNWWRSVKNEDNAMFGLELEICTKLSRREIQAIVTEVEPKQEPFFIFKQDSSISGKYPNKLELVTVPCTPKYLRTHWKIFFKKLQSLCEAKGMTLDDVVDTNENLTNGLHIHVSKKHFINKGHFNKFLTAWNQWDKSATSLFNTVSSRPSHYLDNPYCRINYAYDGKTLARRLKGLQSDDRMSVAHNRTGSTVEVRVYQGIFNLAHIMKCISFTEAMFEFTQDIGYSSFDRRFFPSISKFILGNRKYASLYSLLERKA